MNAPVHIYCYVFVRLKSVLGEALLVEGKAGSLDSILLAVFEKEASGQMDELGNN